MKRLVLFTKWMFFIAVLLAAGNVFAQQQFGPSAPLRPLGSAKRSSGCISRRMRVGYSNSNRPSNEPLSVISIRNS